MRKKYKYGNWAIYLVAAVVIGELYKRFAQRPQA